MITHIGAGLEANAIEGDEHQRRSYPDNGGAWASAGYEYVRAMDLAGNAERVASEAVELLSAPPLPAGTRTILLHPSQLYMQVHESCGHPTELDRAFGTEASYAGTSFLTPDMLGTLPLRQRPVRHRGRRHGPGRPGLVRLGRRGRGRPAGPADQGGDLHRLPELARDGAAHRPGQRAAPCGPTAGTASR